MGEDVGEDVREDDGRDGGAHGGAGGAPRAVVTRPAAFATLAHLAAASARDAVRAVVPLACAGCGAWDHVVCPDCRTVLERHRRLDGDASALHGPLSVWGIGHYEGVLRHLVLAWKLGGRGDVEPLLTAALRVAVHSWHRQAELPDGDLWVVPAPSGPGRRWSGRPAVLRLADPVARELALAGRDTLVVRSLAAARGRHTHTASAGQRRERTARGVRARVPHAGARVVLVDDVMTTGATLEACRGAIEAGGGVVVGAFVLAGARVRGRGPALADRPPTVH